MFREDLKQFIECQLNEMAKNVVKNMQVILQIEQIILLVYLMVMKKNIWLYGETSILN